MLSFIFIFYFLKSRFDVCSIYVIGIVIVHVFVAISFLRQFYLLHMDVNVPTDTDFSLSVVEDD